MTSALFAQEGWQTATVLVRVSKSEQQVEREQKLRKTIKEREAKALDQAAALQKEMQKDTGFIIQGTINVDQVGVQDLGKQITELKQKIAQDKQTTERCKRALEAGQQACDEMIWTLSQSGEIGGPAAGLVENQTDKVPSREDQKREVLVIRELIEMSNQFGADDPQVKALQKEISRTDEVPNRGDQAGNENDAATAKIAETIEHAEMLQKYGADHPRVKALNKKINQTDKAPTSSGQEDKAKVEIRVAELRLKLAEVSRRRGKNHPMVKNLKTQIELLKESAKNQVAENADGENQVSSQEQLKRLQAKLQTGIAVGF